MGIRPWNSLRCIQYRRYQGLIVLSKPLCFDVAGRCYFCNEGSWASSTKRQTGVGSPRRRQECSIDRAGLSPRKNLLERILSVICEVRPGEGLGALILTINLFTLLGRITF